MSSKWETSKDAVPDGFTQITIYAEDTGERVATVFSEANAHKIAAAPELLAALIACQTIINREVPNGHVVHSMRAAIAKAEGR